MDVKETLEVFVAVETLGTKLETVLDDGKVTFAEVIAESAGMLTPAYQAVEGVDKVDDELKDLSPEEVAQLAKAAYKMVQPYVRLMKKKQPVPQIG